MKLLKLVFINIRQGFKSSPLIYLVFIVGSVLSGIAFIYLYGNVMPYMKGDYSTYFSYRTCTAVMDGSEPIREDSFKRLSEYVENWDICDIVIMSDQTGLLTCDKNSVQIPLGASLSNGVETHTYKMSGKQKFGQKEIAEKKKAAIIPYLYWPTGVTADNLSYNGEDFEIAGVYSGSAGFTTVYIPSTLLFELNSKATEVHFILEDFLPEKEYRNFVDQISRLDHVTHVFMPDINATKEISFSYSAAEIGTLCVLFFTSISTYLYLMKYFDDRNKYVNVVYMLSGANQQYTAMILLIQKLILVAGINLISILLHAALQNTVFQSVNILENVSYNGWDYLIIYLAMVLITVLSLIPQMVLYIRRSINTIKTTC